MNQNFDDLCDEEKSFYEWFTKNGESIRKEINIKIIDLLKIMYMKGYASGFQNKLKHSAEEQLQK